MKEQQSQVLRLFSPILTGIHRYALAFLVLFSVALIPLSKFDPESVSVVRIVLVDSISPVLNLLSHPVSFGKTILAEFNQLAELRTEVKRLSSENRSLLKWQAVGRRLEAENNAFRDLLSVENEPATKTITARVIADTGGLFVRTLIINAGRGDGVKDGQAVLSVEGLVGRIVETGESSSRVLQLADFNSRIPIVISPSGQRAILAGDNTDWPQLLFFTNKQSISLGNYVLTSGHGGLFPPGLPVGVISKVGEGLVRVQPFINWHQIEYVKVLNYSINQ